MSKSAHRLIRNKYKAIEMTVMKEHNHDMFDNVCPVRYYDLDVYNEIVTTLNLGEDYE